MGLIVLFSLLGASLAILLVGVAIGWRFSPTTMPPKRMIGWGIPLAVAGFVFAGLSYLSYAALIAGLLLAGSGIGKAVSGKRGIPDANGGTR